MILKIEVVLYSPNRIFIGLSFTWSNRREGLVNIKERLDQCLCDQEWPTLFPKAGVRHLCNSNSDHNSIMLDTHLDSGKWPVDQGGG